MKCLVTGASMSVAGVLTQSLFRNALAAPSVLGVSSGASLMACFVFLVMGSGLAYWILPFASFVGAFLVLLGVLSIARVFNLLHRDNLLLLGFSINIFCGALISLVIAVALEKPGQMPSIMHWLMGDFSYPTPDILIPVLIVGVVAVFFAWKISLRLEVLSVGEEVAETLGVRLELLKYQVLFLVALLVALSVSLVGAIPFVGLIVPHVAKRMIGVRLRKLIPFAAAIGMIFVMLADTLAKTLRDPAEIPTGILLALTGAPFFILVLIREKNEHI